MAKFIEVHSVLFGNKTIAIDQIAHLEPTYGGTKITVKSMEKGNNLIVLCSDDYNSLVEMTRKNVAAGLIESFSDECEKCNGRGLLINDIFSNLSCTSHK